MKSKGGKMDKYGAWELIFLGIGLYVLSIILGFVGLAIGQSVLVIPFQWISLFLVFCLVAFGTFLIIDVIMERIKNV